MIFTALLFTLGKSLISLYIGRSGISSAFGAAGSLVVVLAWQFWLLYLGAMSIYRAYMLRRIPAEASFFVLATVAVTALVLKLLAPKD